MKKVVVIGGGTGTYTVLTGLRSFPELELAAVVTMADDGGSNKVLRDEFGMLPTSGVRQCMVALSANKGLLRELFTYRYCQGKGIAGMTFGNLFMAAATDILGDERAAIKETAKLLSVDGKILPATYDALTLSATFANGVEISGQHAIDIASSQVGDSAITSLRATPKTTLDDEARDAIENADLLVLGPGDLYGNTIVNLIVDGMTDAISKCRGKLVFVTNMMNKMGESPRYAASNYLLDLAKYMPLSRVDYILVNNDFSVDRQVLLKYQEEGAEMVKDDLDGLPLGKTKIIRTELLAKGVVKVERGDVIVRSMVRHDGKKLARELVKIVVE